MYTRLSVDCARLNKHDVSLASFDISDDVLLMITMDSRYDDALPPMQRVRNRIHLGDKVTSEDQPCSQATLGKVSP